MERLQIKAQVREGLGKGGARKIRAQGFIPGVVYGGEEAPLNLTLNLHDFEKKLRNVEGTNVLMDLEVEGHKTLPVMLWQFQADMISRDFLHVDFLRVDLSKQLKVEVPIHLVGKAIGVKEGGILEHIRRQLEVKCLPTQVPTSIDVDVSNLNLGETIHVSDLKFPEGVTMADESEASLTVASIVSPAAEKSAAAGEEEAPTEPEVTTQKKPKEEKTEK